MKIIAIIPSRYGSTRFPGKPLAKIMGRPMIQWVYEHVSKTKGLDAVYVATDDTRILNCVHSFGGNALLTSSKHACGTDRIAECAEILQLQDEDVVLNIQGDEPLIKSEMIEDLIGIFNDSEVYMGTLKKKIDDSREIENSNVVKVVVDKNNDAIYFSRYAIPYLRDERKIIYYKHVGAYGYKIWFLKKFSNMERTHLEIAESLEQLRVIENGYNIRVKETIWQTIGVDTPEQILEVEKMIQEEKKMYE